MAGLDQEYDRIRAQLLARDPFPTCEAYASIQREESRRNIMIYNPTQDRNALLVVPREEFEQIKLEQTENKKRRSANIV